MLMHNVLAGKPGTAVYSINNLGERLTTGFPIFLEDINKNRPQYMVFVITPTSHIYSNIENKLFSQRVETVSLLAITTASIIVLILFLSRWNKNLEREIKRRTNELVISNTDLKKITEQLKRTNDSLKISNEKVYEANKELELQDKLQREFINIAAHELRTPTQVITGYLELALEDEYYKKVDENHGKYLEIVRNNADRLENFIENILDIARIESNNLKLEKVKINLLSEIVNILKEYSEQVLNIKKDYGLIELKLIVDVNKIFNIYSDTKTLDFSMIFPSKMPDSENNKNLSTQEEYYADAFRYVQLDTMKYKIMANVDRVRIYQVMINLLNNAIKSTIENNRDKQNATKKKYSVVVSIYISNLMDILSELLSSSKYISSSSSPISSKCGEQTNPANTEIFKFGKDNKKEKDQKNGYYYSNHVAVQSRYVIISVHDCGKGISEPIFTRLFEKFASFSEKGTGLGLFISKGIIEAHGGKIWAFNNKSGVGATFAFRLPLSST